MEIELKSELAERAWNLEQRLSKCLLNLRNNYLELGDVASKLKAGKLYKIVCPEALNWPHYISLRFDGIGRASLDNYSLVSRLLGNDIADKDIPLNRAIDIARVIQNTPKEDIERTKIGLIECAETLPKLGWQDTLREIRGLTASDCCEHPADKQTMYNHCEICGKWMKI